MKKVIAPQTAEAKKLASGEQITLPATAVKTRRHLSFTADISDLKGGKITVGHGYMISDASWVEITETEIEAHSYYSYSDPQKKDLFEKTAHGIEIKDYITVNIDVSHDVQFIVISSAGGTFKIAMNGWGGLQGDIFAEVEGTTAENCKLNWFSDDLARKIWIIGDSYLGFAYPARWPYYLYRDGYNNSLLVGFAGMGTERGLTEFKRIIDFGEPEIVVWCLGMNNKDPDDNTPQKGYLDATNEFLAICKERGITPILSTIPNTPKVNNRGKNSWVRSQDYRYIDFARAVGSDKIPEWYPEMLFQDQVHPAEKGAAALYMQVLVDFPEIMQRP